MVSSNNAINDTVGASISGVTNTFTVTNPSNTASSAARETITVGGGSAADPTLNFNISGVTNWEMGIDNSDSDKWKLSQGTALGTNDTIVAFTAGQVLKPLQPAFYARLSSTQANVTGDSTAYTVICDQVIFDLNSNYNNVTGVFTAPVTGRYFFSGCIAINSISAAHTGMRAFISAPSDLAEFIHLNPTVVKNLATTWFSQTGAAFFPLTAGQAVTLTFLVSGGTKTVGAQGAASRTSTPVCEFKGWLVC